MILKLSRAAFCNKKNDLKKHLFHFLIHNLILAIINRAYSLNINLMPKIKMLKKIINSLNVISEA